jgi:hypothetical protein
VHALPLEAWRTALDHVAARLGLPESWTRLPGGEDSAVFASGEHVLKLVPPCNAQDAVREAHVLPRLDLGVPSPRLHAVLAIDAWTVLHMSRLPGRPSNELWGELDEPARVALMGELGSLLARMRRVPLYPLLDIIAPGVFFAAGPPARLAALVEAARLQATAEDLAAWHVLHPFSDLSRDLGMAGRSGVSVEAVVDLWRF